MRAIDTNVAARYLLADDPHQYETAKAIMAGDVFIPTTVMLELSWLLGSHYRMSRTVVAGALAELIDLPTVAVEDAASLRRALQRYAAGADFADMVHIVCSGLAETFATFDAGISKEAGPDSPLLVETLA